MSDTPPSNVRARLPMKVTSANKVFWVRPANPALDRAGDWLLKNLAITRASAAKRAGSV